MSRLEEFKDTLAAVSENLEMAEGHIEDALWDLDDGYIGIKSDANEFSQIKKTIDVLWWKIEELRKSACY